MTSRDELDGDDDFSEIYKAYTGPLGSSAPNPQDKAVTNKRSHADSDEEQEDRDPNAVPTDFTSREAKVWEAKSKATERNWKKRKEEEMICKICGESGHFTQGCPSTLGGSRKSQDFFERVPAREPHVKALFSEKVVDKIEKDIGCKIKIEEKFIIVSGKDRLILKKGVDAVHKIKQEGEDKPVQKLPEGNHKGSSGSLVSRSRSPERRSPVTSRLGQPDNQRPNPSRSPERRSPVTSRLGRPDNQRPNPSRSPERRSPVTSRLGRPDNQRLNPSLNNTAPIPHRYVRQEKVVEDRVREDLQKLSGGSPQAYGSDGGRGRSSHSKSPARPSYLGNSYNSYEGHSQSRVGYRSDGWNNDRSGSELHVGREYPSFPKTLEELELQYQREAMELARFRDKEVDEENYKHREAVREMRDSHMKKVDMLKGTHAKTWEEFLQLEGQRRQQQARQYISSAGIGGYKQPNYSEFDNSSGNIHLSAANIPMERNRYRSAMDNYPPSRPHDTYDDFPRERRDDFGKAYNRF